MKKDRCDRLRNLMSALPSKAGWVTVAIGALSVWGAAPASALEVHLPRQFAQAPRSHHLSKLGNGEKIRFEPESADPIALGRGFNTVTGEVGSNCVVVGQTTTLLGDQNSSNGQSVEAEIHELDNLQQVSDSLQIDASASFGLGIFHGDASANFVRDDDFSAENYFLLIQVRVINQTEMLQNYVLTPDAAQALASDRTQFLHMCGNAFIATRVTGGEFSVILEIQTKSADDRQQVALALSGGMLNWSASANLIAKLQEVTSSHVVNVHMLRKGGGGDLPDITPSSVINYALSFPSKVRPGPGSEAWPFTVGTASYDTIADANAANVNVLSDQRTLIESYSKELQTALSQRDEVVFVEQHQDQFVNPQATELAAIERQLNQIIGHITNAATSCISVLPAACQAMDPITYPNINLPQRKRVSNSGQSLQLGTAQCNVQDAENCAGLRNSDAAVDTGISVSAGAVLEFIPAYVVKESISVPSPASTHQTNMVCTASQPIYHTQEECRPTGHGGESCHDVQVQVGTQCMAQQDQGSTTTIYPAPSSTFQLVSNVDDAWKDLIRKGLTLGFDWTDASGAAQHSDCPLTVFQAVNDTNDGVIRYQLDNVDNCSPFGSDGALIAKLKISNKVNATAPVQYKVGTKVETYNGVGNTDQTQSMPRVPLVTIGGVLRIR